MSLIQQVFMFILPTSWAQSMKESSEAWKIECCECGHSRSVWETGGIRWKAGSSEKRTLVYCSQCDNRRLARFVHDES